MQKRDATAGNNAFCNGGAGCVQGVFVKRLAFFHFSFRGGANLYLSHATGELGQTFLQLFAIVFAVCLGDFFANQFAAAFNRLLVASTFGDGGVFRINFHFLGPAKLRKLDIAQVHTQILENRFALGQDSDVFKHCLTAVAVTRSLDSANGHNTLELVKNQGGERFAFDIFGNDHK